MNWIAIVATISVFAFVWVIRYTKCCSLKTKTPSETVEAMLSDYFKRKNGGL